MFLAPYAPDAPDFSKKPYTGNGGYPQYHYNIYKAIQDIGYDVVSSSKPYSVQFAKGNVDYVFSLMNRFAMSRPEIFISSYCEFIQIPYLGAPPNIRAIAEDKLLTKMVFRSLELNVPEGIGLSGEKGIPAQAPFPGPYFVKKRFGAASGTKCSWNNTAKALTSPFPYWAGKTPSSWDMCSRNPTNRAASSRKT